MTESRTITVLFALLSYKISGNETVEKCKSIRAVFSEISNISNTLVSPTVFLSKMIL